MTNNRLLNFEPTTNGPMRLKKLMKHVALLFSIFLLAAPVSFAQKIEKRLILGTWISSTGEPGKTIQGDGGSEISLMPITYSVVQLNLKRFGKAVERTTGYQGVVAVSKFQGKWDLSGDTLRVQFGDVNQFYLVDQSIEERLFLKSMLTDTFVYGKAD